MPLRKFLPTYSRNLRRPPAVHSRPASVIVSYTLTSRCWTTRLSEPSRQRRITVAGAKRTCRIGWAMGAFEYRQAQEIRDCFAHHSIRYLFLGKSGAILLGFPDTTQDADLFVEKTPENGAALVKALSELGFELTEEQAEEVRRGKDFVQLKNGPFDLDLIFAPDGIETFAGAWQRHVEVEGFHVC